MYSILDAANTLIEDLLNEDIVKSVYMRALYAAKNISDIDKVVDAIKDSIDKAEWIEEFLHSSVLESAIANCRAKIKI